MNTPLPTGFLATFAAVLIWGTQLPIAKGAMADIDGYTVTLVRYALAVAGLLPILVWREGFASLLPRGRGALVGSAGAIGMAGSGLLVFVGLSLTRPEAAVIIIALQPATTAIAEWALKGKRPAGFTVGCLVAAFLGVAFVVTRGGSDFDELLRTGPRELIGNALVFVGSSAWVAYSLMVERLKGWSSLRISALSCLAALATIFVVWLVALALGAARVPGAGLLAIHGWRLGYLGLLGVLAAMFLWNVGSRQIGPLNAMLLVNLMPVFTFAMRAIEGASFRPSELAGAAIVVGALISNNLYLRRLRLVAAATPPP